MKKALVFILVISLLSFTGKKYKVELSIEEWNAIYEVVDKSTAPHTQVEAVKSILRTQLEPQLKDTTIKK
jgi:hypothetical protein